MIHADDIAIRVKLGREELGLSQSALAQRAGVSRAMVARVESGGALHVSFGAMVRILNAANWSLYIEKGTIVASNSDMPDLDTYLDELLGGE